MTHRIAVTVRADADISEVRLLIAGCLTDDSHLALLPLIRRAGALSPLAVTVDLSGADHIDASGLLLLRTATDQLEEMDLLEPIAFLLPDRLPSCPSGATAERTGS